MIGSVHIVVKDWIIKAEVAKLKKIANEVASKKITYTLKGSKGKNAEAVNNIITELNNLGTQLGALFNENVENVKYIAVKFKETDDRIATGFKSNG